MRTRRVRCPVWLGAALLLCLPWAPTAEARWHAFLEPSDVLPHASHVLRVAWPPTKEGWPVRAVYRGEGVGGHIRLPGLMDALPGQITARFLKESVLRVRGRGLRADHARLAEMLVALYAMDGRYHVVGGRPGHEVPTRSAVWCVDDQRRVYRDGPGMTGAPILCRVEAHSFEVFEQDLRALLAAHPFEGPNHRPVPEEQRSAFFAILDEGVDWYARTVSLAPDTVPTRTALADRIAAYGRTAPPSMAVHVFDALQILGGGRAVSHEVSVHIHRLLVEIVERAGIETVEPLVLQELGEGPYIRVARDLLLWVLKDADAGAYRRGVEILAALCRRRNDNEAVGAYWALKSCGEDLLVREIDALWAAWDEDDPTSQLLREAAAAQAAQRTAADTRRDAPGSEPTAAAALRPPPRIEVEKTQPAGLAAPDGDEREGGGAGMSGWLPALGILVLLGWVLALRRR